MHVIDLRSDTVTLPTEEMLEAMRTADLGDDVYGEDPTVNRLEEIAAEKMGKEAALLTTSGTQANLVSVMSQAKRGDEVILESDAHLYYSEVGAFSVLGGLVPRLVRGTMGVITPTEIEAALRPPNIHFPPTSLICIENTHNRAGGAVWTPSQTKAVYEFASSRGLKVHMDGARIFNAAIAQDLDPLIHQERGFCDVLPLERLECTSWLPGCWRPWLHRPRQKIPKNAWRWNETSRDHCGCGDNRN